MPLRMDGTDNHVKASARARSAESPARKALHEATRVILNGIRDELHLAIDRGDATLDGGVWSVEVAVGWRSDDKGAMRNALLGMGAYFKGNTKANAQRAIDEAKKVADEGLRQLGYQVEALDIGNEYLGDGSNDCKIVAIAKLKWPDSPDVSGNG